MFSMLCKLLVFSSNGDQVSVNHYVCCVVILHIISIVCLSHQNYSLTGDGGLHVMMIYHIVIIIQVCDRRQYISHY